MSTSSSDRPASFGGPGFRARARSHREEVADGSLWAPYASASEVAPLRAVLLSTPGPELLVDDLDAHLLLHRVDLPAMLLEHRAIAEAYRAAGVEVHVFRPTEEAPPPNHIFVRDLFFMTPEGAVLGRMASEQRAGEERIAQRALAEIGVPIVASVRGRGTLEGADVLYVAQDHALVGVGRRTNEEGARFAAEVLASLGVRSTFVPLPEDTQHLLGVVTFLDHDLAAVDPERASSPLLEALARARVRTVPVEDPAELRDRRAMNFVALGPRRILMPEGAPRTRSALEAHGVEVLSVAIDHYVRCGGGLGCLTGILSRST